MRFCMRRKSGTIRIMIPPTATSRMGMLTAMSQESPTSCWSAMMTPPIASMGADTKSVQVMSTTICTCCTSLVVRVMSEGAPNWETSRSENSLTVLKMPLRRSRPSDIDTVAPKYTAVIAQTTCRRVIPSMTAPTMKMYGMSPLAMPWSTMSALRLGR